MSVFAGRCSRNWLWKAVTYQLLTNSLSQVQWLVHPLAVETWKVDVACYANTAVELLCTVQMTHCALHKAVVLSQSRFNHEWYCVFTCVCDSIAGSLQTPSGTHRNRTCSPTSSCSWPVGLLYVMCTTSSQLSLELVQSLLQMLINVLSSSLFLFVCFQENETAIEFAARVKADICKKGGLVDLPW